MESGARPGAGAALTCVDGVAMLLSTPCLTNLISLALCGVEGQRSTVNGLQSTVDLRMVNYQIIKLNLVFSLAALVERFVNSLHRTRWHKLCK